MFGSVGDAMKNTSTMLTLSLVGSLLIGCNREPNVVIVDSTKPVDTDEKQAQGVPNDQALDPSIVLSTPFGTIENGTAYDKAAVAIGPYKKLILPKNAAIRAEGEVDELQVYMRKTLSFAGHPPEPMSIRTARKNMGCAVKSEGDALILATFGEWDSRIEGGANMRVVCVVPQGIAVEKRSGLSGTDSSGQEWGGEYLSKPKEVKEGYWYGPAIPADGWKAVPAIADPKRTQ